MPLTRATWPNNTIIHLKTGWLYSKQHRHPQSTIIGYDISAPTTVSCYFLCQTNWSVLTCANRRRNVYDRGMPMSKSTETRIRFSISSSSSLVYASSQTYRKSSMTGGHLSCYTINLACTMHILQTMYTVSQQTCHSSLFITLTK